MSSDLHEAERLVLSAVSTWNWKLELEDGWKKERKGVNRSWFTLNQPSIDMTTYTSGKERKFSFCFGHGGCTVSHTG